MSGTIGCNGSVMVINWLCVLLLIYADLEALYPGIANGS